MSQRLLKRAQENEKFATSFFSENRGRQRSYLRLSHYVTSENEVTYIGVRKRDIPCQVKNIPSN